MNEEGEVDDSLHPGLSEDKIKELYHLMMLAREFDEKLFKMQRSGKIGTYASLKGQEACEIGSGYALEEHDWVVPSFREMGVFITRGADRVKLVQGWMGDTRAFQGDENTRDLPIAIPIASQALHAAGIAWASKIKGEKSCAITYFGDGATSEGDFHEALNFAGVFKLPIVFFCQNNQWAISTPRKVQTASETIAQKAISYGIKGVQIDGNDVLAVYKATKEALERARNGEGPTLIEAITFRLGDHTTSDDASKYRSEEEVSPWVQKDPIQRVVKHFQKIGTWSDEYGAKVKGEVEKEVEEAVEKAMQIPPPGPEDVFKYIFKTLPKDLEEEQKELLEEVNEKKSLQDKGDAV